MRLMRGIWQQQPSITSVRVQQDAERDAAAELQRHPYMHLEELDRCIRTNRSHSTMRKCSEKVSLREVQHRSEDGRRRVNVTGLQKLTKVKVKKR